MVRRHCDTRFPSRYAEQEYEALCEQLEHEYGIGYEDSSLEMRIENTIREPHDGRAEPPQQSQPSYLPRPFPELNFTVEVS